MLDVARANARDAGLLIDFGEGRVAFPAATFDVVTSRHLLWTLRCEPSEAM